MICETGRLRAFSTVRSLRTMSRSLTMPAIVEPSVLTTKAPTFRSARVSSRSATVASGEIVNTSLLPFDASTSLTRM